MSLSIHPPIYTYIDPLLSIYLYIYSFIYIPLPIRLPTSKSIINTRAHLYVYVQESTCETLFSKKQLSLLNIYTNDINLSLYVHIRMCKAYLHISLSIHPPIYTYIDPLLSVYLYIYSFIYISLYLSVYLHPYRLPTQVLTCMSMSSTSTCETLFSRKELS